MTTAAKSGTATFYTLAGLPNCSYPTVPASGRYVALSPGEYASGAACGTVLAVTGPKGTVQVTVVDQCPECGTGHLDLGSEAFAAIADPVAGWTQLHRESYNYWLADSGAGAGPLTLRITDDQGHQRTVHAITVTAGSTQVTAVRMY